MTSYLLDTEHVGILQRRSEPEFSRLRSRLDSVAREEIAVSIISFQEQVCGWTAFLNRAKTTSRITFGYRMLQDLLADYQEYTILSYTVEAAEEFDRLKKLRVRVGTLDLRIAAIASVNQRVVLTRNLVDFQRVPGLRCEDWAN